MNILVIRACAIGDFVLNLPALEALQILHPNADFTLVGYPSTLEIARDFIRVSMVRSIESEPWSRLFLEPVHDREWHFDRAIVWMKDSIFVENLRLSGIPNVLRADPFPTTGHAAAHLLETINLPAPELQDRWRPSTEQVILHPGSGGRQKCWPHFPDLAARIESSTFLIGPVETGFNPGKFPLIQRCTLRQVCDLLISCRAFVGNDSGITHLAAYLGVPTIAIFGPTDPKTWRPLGRRVHIRRKTDITAITAQSVVTNLLQKGCRLRTGPQ